MAKTPDRTTLYSPDGRKYDTAEPAEITRLKNRGYTETAPKTKPKPASSTATSSSGS